MRNAQWGITQFLGVRGQAVLVTRISRSEERDTALDCGSGIVDRRSGIADLLVTQSGRRASGVQSYL
jgi:hypothetical protein